MEFPEIKAKDSLVAKHLTKEKWDKLSGLKTSNNFTLAKAVACALEFDHQTLGIYGGDEESYKIFAEVFDPVIQDYHGISANATHISDMDFTKITGNIKSDAPVKSTRIRVARNIEGLGLSPGITKQDRLRFEGMMREAFANLEGDLAGTYYPLTGMEESTRQQLVDDHFLFMSGDLNLKVGGMERDWPEGRGIFHNKDKTFLVWVNEEDQLRIISMQQGADVKVVADRLARGIKAVEDSIRKASGREFQKHAKYGYISSCPSNLGTGMRASVHVTLPGWHKKGLDALKERCAELALQPRGTRGESSGHINDTYDISNKHRLGYSEVELIQNMIDGVNKLVEEDKQLSWEGQEKKTESKTATFMDQESQLSVAEEDRDHVPKIVSFLFGDLHNFVSKWPKSAMCTFCLTYLLWLLIVVILLMTEGENFINMISETPMYVRSDPKYTDFDAYVQAEDESSWDRAANSDVENVQSQNFPNALQNLVLLIEIDGMASTDDGGLLAPGYIQNIYNLENGLRELAGFEQLELIVYDNNIEDYRRRPWTVTNLFDSDYAPWAFDESYDPNATVDNYENFLMVSKYVVASLDVDPVFDETTTNTVKNYYAGYGYMDEEGYEGYNTSYSFKYRSGDTDYTVGNLMHLLADSSFGTNPGETAVSAVMSVHWLGVPIEGYNSSSELLAEQEEKLGEICYKTAHEYLFSRKNANGLNLFWACTSYYKPYYIGEVIAGDSYWLMATISFVFIYMIFNVNSVFIAMMGMFMVFMAFTPGMILYRYLAGYAYFGTLNMLVLFIMLSIGADNIFVLNDTWQQERNRAMVTYRFIREGSDEMIQESIRHRLQCTVGHTGKVMFTTSISTMMSFVANSASSFPAIYCFGAFAAIVVAVNYVAVCTFMPTVLVVHELYFWTDESWACCQRKQRKAKLGEKSVDERRPVDVFLEEKCFAFIYTWRLCILIGFFIMQSIFLIFMARLQPDPNEPLILPAEDPVQMFNTKFTEHFTRFVDPFKITNHIIMGIDGIDRSGIDETVPEDLGKAIFADVSFTSEEEQQFLEQFCSDAITGNRYGDLDGRMVNFEVDVTLQCFMIQVRDSIYEDSYYNIFVNDTLRDEYFNAWYSRMVQRGDTYTRLTEDVFVAADEINSGDDIKEFYTLCFENDGPWRSRSFPIRDPYEGEDMHGACFLMVFLAWLDAPMSASDPNYTPGEANYDHYKDYIWAETRESEEIWSGEYYVNFFEFTVELTIGTKTDFEDALDMYYVNWENWIDNWKNNMQGESAVFQGYGCDDDSSDICVTADFVSMPDSWKSSVMFTDSVGIWTYYVMQSVILRECYSGIFLSLLFAFCVMVLTTGNWLISVYSSIVILGLVIDVMGFTVMLGYRLSVVEAIIYIMVVGMSVDYVVHLAEAYLHSGEALRVHAARRMLGIVGISVISGAVSTIGGIMFLIFSYNQFFFKFGLNIFFLMIMASIYSLIGFTAAMSSFGPQGAQGNTTVCYYWCLSFCKKEYTVKVDELVAELEHQDHAKDALTNLPKSNHAKLVQKRQASLRDDELVVGGQNSQL